MTTETKIVNGTKLKRCNHCGKFKTVEQFHKVKKGKFGVRATCKQCISVQKKQKYQSDEKFRERRRQWSKGYYKNHKEHIKAYVKEWMRGHPEYVKRYVMKWQEENRDHYLKYLREYKAKKNRIHQEAGFLRE